VIGPIRQELLSRIKEGAHFDRLRDHLRAFADTELLVDDYEEAAAFYNRGRARAPDRAFRPVPTYGGQQLQREVLGGEKPTSLLPLPSSCRVAV
jgi:hypothetical protein